MGNALVIHLTDDEVTALRLVGSAKKPRIVRAASTRFELPEPDEDGKRPPGEALDTLRAKQLKTWLKQSKMLGGPVALCVDSSDVLLREMRIAFTDRRQIDKVIAYQVEGLIPSTPIEDLAVGYTILTTDDRADADAASGGKDEDQSTNLLVAAGHKAAIKRSLALLASAKVEIGSADSAIGGTLNMRASNPLLASIEAPTAWVDIQGRQAMICALTAKGVISVRSVMTPAAVSEELSAARDAMDENGLGDADEDAAQAEIGEDTDQIIVEMDGTDDDNAPGPENVPAVAPRLVSRGEPEHTGIYVYPPSAPSANALARMLAREIRRTLTAAPLNERIKRLIVSGVPARLTEQLKSLKRELDLESLEFTDLLAPLVPKDKHGKAKIKLPASPLLAAMAGVGVKLLGRDDSGVNFLSGDLSPTDAFDRIRGPMAAALTLLFMVAGVSVMAVLNERVQLNAQRAKAIGDSDIPQAFEKAYANAGAAEKKERKADDLPADDATELVTGAYRKMEGDMQKIRTGTKRNFPPTYEADRIYQQVLQTIEATWRPPPGAAAGSQDFSLVEFDLKQDVRRKTSGRLTLTCYVPVGKEQIFADALARIKVPNPLWDGKSADQQIEVFENVQTGSTDVKTYVDRGTTTVGGATIRIGKMTYTCQLRELERKAAGKARGTGTRR